MARPERPILPSAVIFLIATGAAAIFALLPLRVMLEHFIYEDMFYYLRVAEFLAAGQGSTFDGTAPTNGYHPAWMAISTLAATLFEGEALVRAMLLLAAVLHGAQAVVLHRILIRYGDAGIALLITMLFALNWRTIATNLCGLETPLSMLMMLVLVDHLSRLSGDRLAARGTAVTLGLLLGLSVYARFDMLLFSALALGFFALLLWRQQGLAVAIGQSVLGGVVVIAALIPWFLFSYSVSGSFLPNSREAVALLFEGGLDLSSGAALRSSLHDVVFGGIHWVSDSANFLGLWPTVMPTGRLGQVAALVLTLFVLWVVISALRHRRDLPPVAWFCLVFFLGHAAYYAVNLRLEVRYVLPAFTAFLIVLGLTLGTSGGLLLLARRLSPMVPVLLLAGATVSGLQAWSKFHGTTRTHGDHGALYDAALWVRDTAPDATVGSWNAGIMSFFSRAEVVNLDGVINDDALAANRTGSIDDYIRARGIGLLADGEGQITTYLTRFAGDTDVMGDILVRYSGIVVAEVR